MAKEKAIPTKEVCSSFKYPRLLVTLFLTSFVIQFSAQSIGPILALYVRDLGQSENLLLVSGLIVSSMGFSSMMSAGILGKLGDKVGNHRLLVAAQIYSVIIYLLCAHATSPLQLGLYRFLFGSSHTGSQCPSQQNDSKIRYFKDFRLQPSLFLPWWSDRTYGGIRSCRIFGLPCCLLCDSSLCGFQLFM